MTRNDEANVTLLRSEFIEGVVGKTIVLGVLVAAVAYVTLSPVMAGAVVLGTLIAAINLRVLAWTTKRMLEAGKRGEASLGFWVALFFGKTLILFGVIWYLIARLGVDATGFVVGFSSFLPAIGWQTLLGPPDEDG